MKAKIITLGCKVNSYESEIIKEKFIQDNYEIVEEEPADVVVVNTCSVTNNADAKSRKIIRKAYRENPGAIMVVCGCASMNHQENLLDIPIDILLGNKDKSKIVELVNNYKKTKVPYHKFYNDQKLEFEDMTVTKFTGKTRAFIKVQDGCNNFCSYCIIPYMRGNLRNKDFNKAVNEVKELSKYHNEIVLTGIHTGSYYDNGHDLTDLIYEISKIDAIKRIRISSIEVTELNEKFLEMLKNNPKVCNHLHIPLQAGSDEILKKMNRKYNTEYFINKITKIRSIRPDISITTDIIVGFPYETDELFNETINISKKIKFAKIHVFPYSKRENTVASTMSNQVSEPDKKERSRKLCELSDQLEKEYYEKFINQKLDIIIEEHDQKYSYGTTSNYLKVKIKGNYERNTEMEVTIKEIVNNMAIAVK